MKYWINRINNLRNRKRGEKFNSIKIMNIVVFLAVCFLAKDIFFGAKWCGKREKADEIYCEKHLF